MNIHHVSLDHIAILVSNLSRAIHAAYDLDWEVGDSVRFEGEGSEEVYIGKEGFSRLLFIQAIGPGPYQDAMEKRGPGIHHLGIGCKNVKNYTNSLKQSGWREHAQSAHLWEQTQSFWLQRSGAPLLEISKKAEILELDYGCRFPFRDQEALRGLARGIENGGQCVRRDALLWNDFLD